MYTCVYFIYINIINKRYSIDKKTYRLLSDDSSPVSLIDFVTGFISAGIVPTFGILRVLALKVLDLSLKSHTNDPVLESDFYISGQFESESPNLRLRRMLDQFLIRKSPSDVVNIFFLWCSKRFYKCSKS